MKFLLLTVITLFFAVESLAQVQGGGAVSFKEHLILLQDIGAVKPLKGELFAQSTGGGGGTGPFSDEPPLMLNEVIVSARG